VESGGILAIPDSFLDELVSRTDIVDLVGGYVKFTKRSGGNMFGLCPFHSEKTPSFSVNRDKQIYHCFGCGKGGGAINFMMEIENIAFRDAIEMLANRAGMAVPDSGAHEDQSAKRRRMLGLNRDAARFYYEMLASPSSAAAREYLANRMISKAFVTKFGIGMAPDAWTSLTDAMKKKGYSQNDLIEAGLAKAGPVKEGRGGAGIYDIFRNRLMFPVIDVRGEVIGFSGRILGEGEPKYLNSPDTMVFSKKRNLFALNLAKKTKMGMLILVEGNIDVVSLHQAGFDSAVASLGTAFTDEQARLMAKYTDKAVIAYDSDEAGRRAALRAIPFLEKTGMGIKVLDMGSGKDPDEFIKTQGADAFRILLDRSENHIEYRLMTIRRSYDLTSDEGRVSYLAAATDMVSSLESEPEREVFGSRVANETGISAEAVKNEVRRKVKINENRQKKGYEKSAIRLKPATLPDGKPPGYKNEGSAAAEEGIVRCLARDTALLSVIIETGLSTDEFSEPFYAKLFDLLMERITEGRDVWESLILAELPPNEASALTKIMQKPESLQQNVTSMYNYISKIRSEKFKKASPDMEMLMEIMKYRQVE